jgi:hypothetical protein
VVYLRFICDKYFLCLKRKVLRAHVFLDFRALPYLGSLDWISGLLISGNVDMVFELKELYSPMPLINFKRSKTLKEEIGKF